MQPYVVPLATALGHLQQATMWLMQTSAKPDNAGAAATDYMHLMGLVVLGCMWCRIVEAANAGLAADMVAERMGAERMRARLMTGRFFVERMLPETALHLARIQTGPASVMELPA